MNVVFDASLVLILRAGHRFVFHSWLSMMIPIFACGRNMQLYL
jgi:hypothetical protein